MASRKTQQQLAKSSRRARGEPEPAQVAPTVQPEPVQGSTLENRIDRSQAIAERYTAALDRLAGVLEYVAKHIESVAFIPAAPKSEPKPEPKPEPKHEPKPEPKAPAKVTRHDVQRAFIDLAEVKGTEEVFAILAARKLEVLGDAKESDLPVLLAAAKAGLKA